MKRTYSALLALLAMVGLMGCGNGSGSVEPSGVTSEWEGPAISQQDRSFDTLLYVRLSQNGVALSGGVVTRFNGILVAGKLTGRNDQAANPTEPLQFTATFYDSRMIFEGREIIQGGAHFLALRYQRYALDGQTIVDAGAAALAPYVPPPDDGGGA
jgi:hypothetical protein